MTDAQIQELRTMRDRINEILKSHPRRPKDPGPLFTPARMAAGADREHAAYLSEKQRRERSTEQYRTIGDAIKMELIRRQHPDPHGERQIRSMRAGQAINRFVGLYGKPEYKSLGVTNAHILHDAVMASDTPQEFMEAVEDKAVPHGT